MKVIQCYILSGKFGKRTDCGIYANVVGPLNESRLKGLDLAEWDFVSYPTLCVMETSQVMFSKTTADCCERHRKNVQCVLW
jgi:hypothetical protein